MAVMMVGNFKVRNGSDDVLGGASKTGPPLMLPVGSMRDRA